jgi:hypothetical protein
MNTRLLVGLALIGIGPHALAEDHSVGAKIGLLGLGVEYSYRINELITVRAGLNGSSYTFDDTKSSIDYELELGFDSLSVGVDFHPTKGAFRLSVGALQNDNSIVAQSNPTQSFNVGGTTYTAAEVGTLRGAIVFDSFAPYAGLGWDWMRDRAFGVSFDLGLVSQGAPTVRLSATGPILGDPQFQSDLATEQRELQGSLDDFDLYPFANFGFIFRF